MDGEEVCHRLLSADEDERRRLLRETSPLPTAFFIQLKGVVRQWMERDSKEALRLANIGLEAAEYAEEAEGVAYAWWARGNALLFLGHYDDSLAAYETAISFFSARGRKEEVAQLQSNCMLPFIWTGRYAEAFAMGRKALTIIASQGATAQRANLLLNLSLCADHEGNFQAALAHATLAAEIFDRLGDPVQMARALVNRAMMLERLDRFFEAEETLLRALQVLEEHGRWVPWARAALNLGRLYARLAEHWAAIRWLERSREAFLQAGIEMDAAITDLYRAYSLLQVGLPKETIALGQAAAEMFAKLKMVRHIARTAALLAEAHLRLGKPDLAWEEAERSRDIFSAQGNSMEMALLDLRRAEILRRLGRPGAALKVARIAADALDVVSHPLRHAEAHLVIAACCEDLGRLDEAQLAYRAAWESGSHPTGTTEPPPSLAYRISYARGVLAEAAGERLLARGEYGRAVDYLSRVTLKLGLDELRGSYLTDKRMIYESALRLALEDSRLDESFRYSELARAGSLRDFLAGRRLPGSGMADGPGGRSRSLLALRSRWAWQVERVIPVLPEEVEEEEERTVNWYELIDLERELTAAYRRRRLDDSRFSLLGHGEVPTPEEVRSALPERTALLAFEHVGNDMLVFVISEEQFAVVPLGDVNEVRRIIEGVWFALDEAELFAGLDEEASLEMEMRADLGLLYRRLLAPSLDVLAEQIDRLLVVPCESLSSLPMEMLFDGEHYVVERYSVGYLPAAGLLGVLPTGGLRDGRPLILACSADGRLPAAVEEGRLVADILTGRLGREPLLFVESEATTAHLREYAGMAGVVHIAAHGLFRSDAPLLSFLRLADGLLMAGDVYDLNLPASLVTLSGCQTGLGERRGGELLGLTQAFFFAGAAALVVSRWPVDDRATALLMSEFYTRLAEGQPVVDALRAAQLSLRQRYPHPRSWASFAVWGKGLDGVG